ncbi:hypothetical protein Pcinc_033357 [Petrolisthes cinctipes]|uniref:Secreted protein n=1 Tax=Petrolisthes cinctipes TaxID=88211 RepID=A0AAE1ESA4_PETCI|nr:hypothetical protein Pcinc_033357 [Petrolisthes cinctipes]
MLVLVVVAVCLALPAHKKHRVHKKHHHLGKRSAEPNPSGGHGKSGATATVSGGLDFSGKSGGHKRSSSGKASGTATVTGGLIFPKLKSGH